LLNLFAVLLFGILASIAVCDKFKYFQKQILLIGKLLRKYFLSGIHNTIFTKMLFVLLQ